MDIAQGVSTIFIIGMIILFLPILVPLGICYSGVMLTLGVFGIGVDLE